MDVNDENYLSPCEQAAQIAQRQNSGEDAKNLIFSPYRHEDNQIKLSQAAQVRRQRMAAERRAENHLIKNRRALSEQQHENRRSLQKRQAREALLLQAREKKKQELYGDVKSRVFDKNYAASKSFASSEDDCNNNFSIASSSHKSYGKVPKYISDRKAQLERERWG